MTEFISRNYGNEGYEIIIKTDSHLDWLKQSAEEVDHEDRIG